LCEEARGLKVGDGMLADTQMGPVVDTLQLAKIERQIADARERGAEVAWGGRRLPRKGYFLEPAVITDISNDMLMMREETFGPVAPVIPFDDFDEAISLANASTYGLSAIVCTGSAARAMKALQSLDAGMIKINTLRGKAPGATSEPRKASGLGHGYGIEVMQELTRQKSVHWRAEL
jgi:acyl-CoA reductase-like NAD-dependent aldehyde dehydrogenase